MLLNSFFVMITESEKKGKASSSAMFHSVVDRFLFQFQTYFYNTACLRKGYQLSKILCSYFYWQWCSCTEVKHHFTTRDTLHQEFEPANLTGEFIVNLTSLVSQGDDLQDIVCTDRGRLIIPHHQHFFFATLFQVFNRWGLIRRGLMHDSTWIQMLCG